MSTCADEVNDAVRNQREFLMGVFRAIDMTGYDHTTASHGDSRDPWPQPDDWRHIERSDDVRGHMYWAARDYA